MSMEFEGPDEPRPAHMLEALAVREMERISAEADRNNQVIIAWGWQEDDTGWHLIATTAPVDAVKILGLGEVQRWLREAVDNELGGLGHA